MGRGGRKGQKLSLDTATATDVVSGKTRTIIRELSSVGARVTIGLTEFGCVAATNCGLKGVFQDLVMLVEYCMNMIYPLCLALYLESD